MSSSLAAMASSLPERMQPLINKLSANPLTTGVVSVVALYSLKQVVADYRAWLAIGLGGMSPNFWGYLEARAWGLLGSTDLKSTHVYRDAELSTQFLPSDLPVRAGRSPPVSGWAFPVRQLSSRSSPELRAALDDMLTQVIDSPESKKLAAASLDITKAASHLEGGYSSALFVSGKPGSKIAGKKFEAYHIHGFEGSAHLRVSSADAKLLLDRGWGERHPLSGRMPGRYWRDAVPLTYVMVYAPRNEEEVKIHELGAKASMAYAAESLGVKV